MLIANDLELILGRQLPGLTGRLTFERFREKARALLRQNLDSEASRRLSRAPKALIESLRPAIMESDDQPMGTSFCHQPANNFASIYAYTLVKKGGEGRR